MRRFNSSGQAAEFMGKVVVLILTTVVANVSPDRRISAMPGESESSTSTTLNNSLLPAIVMLHSKELTTSRTTMPATPTDTGQTSRTLHPSRLSPVTELYPYNVTIHHLSPRSVEIIWSCPTQTAHDKYEVSLKPLEASYRVIETVPSNICFLRLERLDPNTSYQVSVASVSGRNRRRSSSIIFKTYAEMSDEDYDDGDGVLDEGSSGTSDKSPPSSSSSNSLGNKDRLRLPRVRLVEVSLVGMALILWGGAIVLFFHRWGKIRMLLPYQPDYKEMKGAATENCGVMSHQYCRIHKLAFATGDLFGGAPPPGTVASGVIPPSLIQTSVSSHHLPSSGGNNHHHVHGRPICGRQRLNSFVVFDMSRDDSLDKRKSRSAEHLAHIEEDYSSSPATSNAFVGGPEIVCTEF